MTTVFIRTLIMYTCISAAIKLMGKRQIGELQLSELVTTLLISELAAYPITDNAIPLAYGLVPLITLLSLEVILSKLVIKNNFLKRLINTSPCILINKGKLDQKKLSSVRFTVDELISELRLSGYPDITTVEYAILEPSGKISVIPKAPNAPLTVSAAGVTATEKGIPHAVVINGAINKDYLTYSQRNADWIYRESLRQGYEDIKQILLMTVDESGATYIIRKDNPK